MALIHRRQLFADLSESTGFESKTKAQKIYHYVLKNIANFCSTC